MHTPHRPYASATNETILTPATASLHYQPHNYTYILAYICRSDADRRSLTPTSATIWLVLSTVLWEYVQTIAFISFFIVLSFNSCFVHSFIISYLYSVVKCSCPKPIFCKSTNNAIWFQQNRLNTILSSHSLDVLHKTTPVDSDDVNIFGVSFSRFKASAKRTEAVYVKRLSLSLETLYSVHCI